MIWPLVWRSLQRYSPYVTLPFAGLVGFIGYNLENWLSDKYTPYAQSIKDQRSDRLMTDEALDDGKIKAKHSVLDTNLSPSLAK